LEEGDIQFLAFVVGNGFLGFVGAAAVDAHSLKVLPAAGGRSLWIHATANLGRSGQQRYIFGGAIKRFLVQKPQLVALSIPAGLTDAG
jgi:hypothetical protein